MSIITAFSDGSIFVWFLDTFTLQWKLSLEQLTGPIDSESRKLTTSLLSMTRHSYFATSSDGEVIAYSGLSSTLYVWNIVEKRLMHEIIIPSFQDQWITQIQFLGNTKVIRDSSLFNRLLLFCPMKVHLFLSMHWLPSLSDKCRENTR